MRSERQMDGFREVVTRCQFRDLGFNVNKFTWFTIKDGGIKVRLDRALATQSWMDLFRNHMVSHLNKSTSDHVPILVS